MSRPRLARGFGPLVAFLLSMAFAPAFAGAADDSRLEPYLDGLLGGLMATHHVPGAVVVIVRDGRVVLSKGYGVADVETRRPVDPERTGFRVASVSKLFVATAVLQQVEAGHLDLDADVNRYLEGWQLEEGFGEPVTLRHLLTHTGGFDDRFLRSAEPLEREPTPLGDYLAARMPPRVMPPGRFISYSNHGYALAGHLVERASGQAFEGYVAEHVFAPLGMTHSRFGIPRPVPPDVARPYDYRGARYHDLGFDRLRDGPAGDLLTTGDDMARFMLAHLGDGALDGARILSPESARAMRRQQFGHLPGLPGWGLGFAIVDHPSVAAVGHGGSWRGFGTNLTLVPEARLGWFVSTNHDFHARFFAALRRELWEYFFPGAAPPPGPPEARRPAADYAGYYVPNRRVRTSFLKLGALLSEMRITASDDGTLVVASSTGLGPRAERLVPTGDDRFVTADGSGRVAFRRDETGRVDHAFLGSYVLDRVSPWGSPRNHALLAAVLVVLFLGTLVGWALGALARATVGAPTSPLTTTARLVAATVCLLDAGLLIHLTVELMAPDVWELMVEVPAATRAALWLPLLSLPPTLALPFLAPRAVRPGTSAPLARLHYALLAVAGLLFLAGAWHWNLTPLGL